MYIRLKIILIKKKNNPPNMENIQFKFQKYFQIQHMKMRMRIVTNVTLKFKFKLI